MLLHSLKLQNLLSFGPDAPEVPLGPLNVLIGPNGSGKSNFIDGISFLQALPSSLSSAIRRIGGPSECYWKNSEIRKGRLKRGTILTELPRNTFGSDLIYHLFTFGERHVSGEFVLTKEEVVVLDKKTGEAETFFEFDKLSAEILEDISFGFGDLHKRKLDNFDFNESIINQIKDSERFFEVTRIGQLYSQIRIYREWSFGRQSPLRFPQPADTRNDFLEENCLNLGLVLNRIRREPKAKKQLLDGLKALYAGIDDFDVTVEGGTVQVFLQEGDITIPATRLSDGTLRYLCLLAILCHPSPPPLICIEEPELGLHPDLMPTLADLMRDASERTQIIATTHSDILVDALTETPDSILVCEKHGGSTTLKRLNQEDLKVWLKDYSLGELWRSGQIGGNRW